MMLLSASRLTHKQPLSFQLLSFKFPACLQLHRRAVSGQAYGRCGPEQVMRVLHLPVLQLGTNSHRKVWVYLWGEQGADASIGYYYDSTRLRRDRLTQPWDGEFNDHLERQSTLINPRGDLKYELIRLVKIIRVNLTPPCDSDKMWADASIR